ncbi:MAG TPA: tRNA lysidine(34) synthetase TilS [Gemmatimonadaceae bacterium]|nr:tRNA lysidine(34) synthetase TilS [Gemmatimonadaceae bacterium]
MLTDPGRAVLRAARRAAREADAPLLLAVSGGLDSMALLHAMATVARARIAAVATFDHGTGAAATAAAAHVARVGLALGLPVVTGVAGARDAGREAAWRRARYEFLRSSAAPLGARIVTAHTADDHLETVLLRLLRGSGTRGLAALLAPGAVARPFLALRHATLLAYARSEKVRWQEDPSNRSRSFLRNRVRLDLLPALRRVLPSVDEVLLDTARRAAAWRAEVESFVDVHLPSCVANGERLVIARGELAGYDRDSLGVLWPALAGRVGLALDRRGTHRLASFTISQRRAGSMPLSGAWRVDALPEWFVLRRDGARASDHVPLPDQGSLRWGDFSFVVGDAGAQSGRTEAGSGRDWSASLPLAARLVVRPWCAGDRLAPAAGQLRRRVKRYLTEAGVRGADRKGWPVVVAGDEVVWIPGVRRSDAATERSGRPVRHYACERIDR